MLRLGRRNPVSVDVESTPLLELATLSDVTIDFVGFISSVLDSLTPVGLVILDPEACPVEELTTSVSNFSVVVISVTTVLDASEVISLLWEGPVGSGQAVIVKVVGLVIVHVSLPYVKVVGSSHTVVKTVSSEVNVTSEAVGL